MLRMLGNGRLEAQCIDGTKRLCHIRGKMRKKVWVNQGDIVLVGLRDYQVRELGQGGRGAWCRWRGQPLAGCVLHGWHGHCCHTQRGADGGAVLQEWVDERRPCDGIRPCGASSQQHLPEGIAAVAMPCSRALRQREKQLQRHASRAAATASTRPAMLCSCLTHKACPLPFGHFPLTGRQGRCDPKVHGR